VAFLGTGMPLTVGTAGHIDHGKSALVQSLTGKDPDRLPEERERGISIDLGYAALALPGGGQLSVIDVPGHERFVHTMVAGATGIDLFLLVIDAAEGARPQTHEHLAILRLLGVRKGVVALTKADLVDDELLELARAEAEELVPGAPVVVTSARTGAGLEELRIALAETAAQITPADVSGPARLYVDRVFTLRGIGTVATGTLWSGSIAAGDQLVVQPEGPNVRVRSVQVHDQALDRAGAGQRVAVALSGIERQDLRRGHALVSVDAFTPSYRLDVALEELTAVPVRAHVHHGTADVSARVVKVGDGYAQLRLRTPVVAGRGDRLILRAGGTVGGGRVIDPVPPRHADPERMELIERGDVAATIYAPVREAELRHILDRPLENIQRAGEWVFSPRWLAELRSDLDRRLTEVDPIDPGITPPSGPWARSVESLLGLERRGAKLYRPGAIAELGARAEAATALEQQLEEGPVRVADRLLARYLEQEGRLVRLGNDHAISPAAYERALDVLRAEFAQAGEVTLSRFRDRLGVGRSTAQLVLERFDADGVTRRLGDRRILRRSARPANPQSN
jgi:selenocysteine-specific elongation factor